MTDKGIGVLSELLSNMEVCTKPNCTTCVNTVSRIEELAQELGISSMSIMPGYLRQHYEPKYEVKLTYFKQSGKYYSEGRYETNKEYMYQIVEEVKMLNIEEDLPDIGKTSEFSILVTVADNHPNGYPCLIHTWRD